jgi:hypothetical protein
MGAAELFVPAFADNPITFYDDSTHSRVRLNRTDATPRKL